MTNKPDQQTNQTITNASLFYANAFFSHYIYQWRGWVVCINWSKHTDGLAMTYLILLPVLSLTHCGTGLFIRALRANTRFIFKDLYAP